MSKNKIVAKKEKALRFFSKKLLRNLKKEIKAVYLFGSLAHGKPEKESDIDVLVFSDNPKKTSSLAWDISLQAYEKFGESIESMVYSSKKYKQPNSYFLYQITTSGRKVYPR